MGITTHTLDRVANKVFYMKPAHRRYHLASGHDITQRALTRPFLTTAKFVLSSIKPPLWKNPGLHHHVNLGQ